jgi:hypothetical protein
MEQNITLWNRRKCSHCNCLVVPNRDRMEENQTVLFHRAGSCGSLPVVSQLIRCLHEFDVELEPELDLRFSRDECEDGCLLGCSAV